MVPIGAAVHCNLRLPFPPVVLGSNNEAGSADPNELTRQISAQSAMHG